MTDAYDCFPLICALERAGWSHRRIARHLSLKSHRQVGYWKSGGSPKPWHWDALLALCDAAGIERPAKVQEVAQRTGLESLSSEDLKSPLILD